MEKEDTRDQQEKMYLTWVNSFPSTVEPDQPSPSPQELCKIISLSRVGNMYTEDYIQYKIRNANHLIGNVKIRFLKDFHRPIAIINAGYLNVSKRPYHSWLDSRTATIFISSWEGDRARTNNKDTALEGFLNYILNTNNSPSVPPKVNVVSWLNYDGGVTQKHTEENFADNFFKLDIPQIINKLIEDNTNILSPIGGDITYSSPIKNKRKRTEDSKAPKISPPLLEIEILIELSSFYDVCAEIADDSRESCRSLLYAISNPKKDMPRGKVRQKVSKYRNKIVQWAEELKKEHFPLLKNLNIRFQVASLGDSTREREDSPHLYPICKDLNSLTMNDDVPIFCTRLNLYVNRDEVIESLNERILQETEADGRFKKKHPSLYCWLQEVSSSPIKSPDKEDKTFYERRRAKVKELLKRIKETDTKKKQNWREFSQKIFDSLPKIQGGAQYSRYSGMVNGKRVTWEEGHSGTRLTVDNNSEWKPKNPIEVLINEAFGKDYGYTLESLPKVEIQRLN